MNPTDAMPKDYQMYYDGCWMEHTKHGVGLVRVIDGTMYLDKDNGMTEAMRVKPSFLSCWWPRPGAFNCKDHAVYVARRAMRNMRKSAVANDHYFVKWGSPYGKDVMMVLKEGQNHLPLREALAVLRSKKMTSVAISRDIIIEPEDMPSRDVQSVVFRGIDAGRLNNGMFEPLFSNSPLTARVLRQLERVL